MRSSRTRYRKPFTKEVFSVSGPAEGARDTSALGEYLRAAKFDVTHIDRSGNLEAHLAHYARTTLALVRTPPVSVRWSRDAGSLSRVLMLVARQGELEVSTSAPLVRRGSNAALILPGDCPVDISATAPQNELIYISAGVESVPSAAVHLLREVAAPPIPWRKLAPLYAFVRAICLAPPPPDDEPDLLSSSSAAIVESFMRTIVGDITPSESLTLQVRAFIREYHVNSHVTPVSIAAQFAVAPRTLQLAFAQEGSSVRAELRAARAATAARLAETHPRLTQAQRAQMAGFPSLSAMYRAMSAGQPIGAATDAEEPSAPEAALLA